MIRGWISIGDFVLEEPDVFYWVRYINEDILPDYGYRTWFLDDVYNKKQIYFDNADDDDGAETIEDFPMEVFYQLMCCINCGFNMSLWTEYLTDNPTRYYNLLYLADSEDVEITERDENGKAIRSYTCSFEEDEWFTEEYREGYQSWLEDDGEVDWEG